MSFLTDATSDQNLSHKQSTRRLSTSNRLRSSEVTLSDHSSLYDAVPLSHSSQYRDYSWCFASAHEDESQTLEDVGKKGGCEATDPNKHVGTRLFTIIEQKSVPSLKTTPSRCDLQRRIFSLQPKLSSEVAQAHHSRVARRRCHSADDSVFHRRYNKSDVSHAASAEIVSESQGSDRGYSSPSALPVQPPYPPPKRMQTPTGIPRWPGEPDHDQAAIQQLRVKTSRRSLLLQYLRRPLSRPKLKEVMRGERTATFDRAVRTGTRFWRPPTSGHSTRRYEDLDSHPFSFVPVADVREPLPASRCQTTEDETVSHNAEIGQLRASDNGEYPGKYPGSTNGQLSLVGESLRALRHASQNAVPVSSLRASVQSGARSAAIPAHIRTPSIVERVPIPTSRRPEIGTMRTAELFESFPSPPGLQQRPQRVQPRKRSSWSLFPASGGVEDIGQRPPDAQKRQALTNSDESTASNVAIRGESQARYRHSGVPYDPERVSLRAFDQEREDPVEYGILGAGPTMIEPSHRTESERAILNGARRFSTRLDAPIPNPSIHSRPQISENRDPAVTRRHEPRQLCKHRLAKLRSLQKKHPDLLSPTYDATHLDGTSTPNPPSQTIAQDYAFTGPSISTQARASISPLQQVVRPPTTTTFVTAPNGATTYSTSSTMGPSERTIPLASVQTSKTMPGRA